MINNSNNNKSNYIVCFVQCITFFRLCKGRVAIYGMLQVCLSEESPAWLDSFQLLLEICHLLGTEGMFITVSRVTLAAAKKQLSYIMERVGSKEKKLCSACSRLQQCRLSFSLVYFAQTVRETMAAQVFPSFLHTPLIDTAKTSQLREKICLSYRFSCPPSI